MVDAVAMLPLSVSAITARFPNPEGFLAGEIDLDTAAIPSMQALDLAGRNAIVAAIRDDMKEPLLEVTQEDHVVIPFHAFFARAVRPKVLVVAGIAEPKLESSASQERTGNAINTISPT